MKSTTARAKSAAPKKAASTPRATTADGTPKARTTRAARATKAASAATTGTAVLDAPRTPSHDEIALRAHLLYEQSGHTNGRDEEFWLEAERQLYAELNP